MVDRVCGTGDWNGPKPGDPDVTNLILTATAGFGGIELNWTFPLVNPEAVAYTIVFRALVNDATQANMLVNAAGSYYFDRTVGDSNLKYYYWIRVVSIYGTVGDLIGPASATAKPTIEQIIIDLTGQIDAGVLAQSLKQSIDQITLNKLGITQAMLDSDAADATLGVMLNEIRGDLDGNSALLQQEVLARVTANESFVSAVNTIYATFQGNIAAIQVEQRALATADTALAAQINTVQSSLGGSIASVQQTMTTNINRIDGKIVDIGALWTARVDVNGLIGGFGVYNNGSFVEAGFDVDRFWIGRTTDKKKPFIVDGGTVYIDEALINKLTFDKLRSSDGGFVVANGLIKANYIQIGIAQVDTLMIQGNAVTVPSFVQASDNVLSYSNINVLALGIYLDQPGFLYANCTGYIAYPEGFGNTVTTLLIDNQVVSQGGGDQAWVSAAHAGGLPVGAGYHVITMQYGSPSGKGIMTQRSLFAMGVKR